MHCGGSKPARASSFEHTTARRSRGCAGLDASTIQRGANIDIYIPLQVEGGVRPKAPAVGAWQSPGYKGVDLSHEGWLGLRCDDFVVIDCDTLEAAQVWERHRSTGWVRKTPRGFHFIYSATPGSPDAPAAGVWPHIDIRAGRTSHIVFRAPNYRDITPRSAITQFNPTWLPDNYGVQQDRSNDESWDEIPEGRGNNTMAAFAGAFRKQGMGVISIAKCLGAINRICMTDDPMPDHMIVEIARSVGRYEPRPDIDIEVVE